MDEVICLTEDLLIDKGAHKKVYADPLNAHRCIKILFAVPDTDIERELTYRKIRKKRNLVSSLLPVYYGTVQTNLGMGYVFERIVDFDGQTSKTLRQFFEEAKQDEKLLPLLEELLLKFKAHWFQEMLVISDVDPSNFMLQRISETEYKIRVVDNIGSPVFLPLAYYVDVIAQKRVKKYWRRFLNEMQICYPKLITGEVKLRLW
ncbi:hypothetical protein IJ556_02560 [bacterium]|nr:hypothetical protein [bacterium]